jgi:hypothetical protein
MCRRRHGCRPTRGEIRAGGRPGRRTHDLYGDAVRYVWCKSAEHGNGDEQLRACRCPHTQRCMPLCPSLTLGAPPIRSCRPLPFVALSTAGQSEAHRRGKEKRNRKTKAAVAVVPSAAAVVVQGPRLLVSCRDPNKRATGGKSAGGVRFAAPGLVRPTPTHPRVRRLSRRAPTARASFPSLNPFRAATRARARASSLSAAALRSTTHWH